MNSPQKLYNLIVITSDEMRGDCLGFMGSDEVKTPALDAFAQRAVTFENHFCNFPKCVPSRISLFTGRRPRSGGYRDIFHHLSPEKPDLKMWAQQHGYQTALFGKSHCWEGDDFSKIVDVHSWCKKMQHHWDDAEPESIEFIDYGDPVRHDSRRVGRCSGTSTDEVYISQACDYLENVRSFAQPFMMVVNLEKPHTPYAVSEPYFSMYDRGKLQAFPRELPHNAPLSLRAQHKVRAEGISEEQLREIQAVYYGMVSKIDSQVGRLFAHLDKLGLWEHSIVLFVSDHGDWCGQFGLTEKWDTSFNECMVRVPCILHAPNLAGGRRVASVTEMVDIVPTIMDLMGALPDWSVHGTSLINAIEGQPDKRVVFCDGGHEKASRERFRAIHGDCPVRSKGMLLDKQDTYRQFPDSMARARMARSATHKLVIRETGDHEFYDMVKDPWELNNLWGQPGIEPIVHELQVQMIMEDLRCDPDAPVIEQVGA